MDTGAIPPHRSTRTAGSHDSQATARSTFGCQPWLSTSLPPFRLGDFSMVTIAFLNPHSLGTLDTGTVQPLPIHSTTVLPAFPGPHRLTPVVPNPTGHPSPTHGRRARPQHPSNPVAHSSRVFLSHLLPQSARSHFSCPNQATSPVHQCCPSKESTSPACSPPFHTPIHYKCSIMQGRSFPGPTVSFLSRAMRIPTVLLKLFTQDFSARCCLGPSVPTKS